MFFRLLRSFVLLLFAFTSVLIFAGLNYVVSTLPSPDLPPVIAAYPIKTHKTILAVEPIAGKDGELRKPIALADVNPNMVKALIAAEDNRFYTHHGIDAIGVLRATLDNIKAGHMVEGGSTITQQLVKNAFLDWRDKSAGRKFREWILAWQLESKYSKQRILEAYLNEVYFGNGAYGIESASEKYFGISALSLDLAQSAFLASLLKAPSELSLPERRQAALSRQKEVLLNMVEYGLASESAATKAAGESLKIRN